MWIDSYPVGSERRIVAGGFGPGFARIPGNFFVVFCGWVPFVISRLGEFVCVGAFRCVYVGPGKLCVLGFEFSLIYLPSFPSEFSIGNPGSSFRVKGLFCLLGNCDVVVPAVPTGNRVRFSTPPFVTSACFSRDTFASSLPPTLCTLFGSLPVPTTATPTSDRTPALSGFAPPINVVHA